VPYPHARRFLPAVEKNSSHLRRALTTHDAAVARVFVITTMQVNDVLIITERRQKGRAQFSLSSSSAHNVHT
jgi:hypothetical protein